MADSDWKSWQAENIRLALAGWQLTTLYYANGSVEYWDEKNGVRIRRDPPEQKCLTST